jgi:pantoate--beta-alanine ligase|tara:strand:- start:683 stop:1498 length:816 start_codon:yes stop_codon:yes gene_type:complete
MKIFQNKKKLIKEILGIDNIAFIPTMGALHKGHISLINKAKKKSNKVLVSIYINPKQFNTQNDFKKYPRKLNKDIKCLKNLKINYLYVPNNKDMYSFKTKKKIHLDNFSRILCGKFRPNHFKGVINVINRFLEIIKPKYLYLGIKDLQQLMLIKSHIIKNKIKTHVVPCATIRSANGVALSSRNSKLNKNQLRLAEKIYRFIKNNKKIILSKNLNKKKLEVTNKLIQIGANKVDYIECVNLDKKKICVSSMSKFNVFVAYYLGKIRMIDNL